MEDKEIEQLALEADEPIEKAIAYLHRKASEQYLKSTGFSASPFGLDGVPHVRFRAIAQAMLDYHSEIVLDEYPKAQELLDEKWISEIEKAFFWTKCNYGYYCWEWQGSKNKNCYGTYRFNGKSILAHRLSYLIINGSIDKDLCVLHECDNPSCINPSHLFLGTPADNAKDKSFKNRARNTRKSSKYIGVTWRNDICRWRCFVMPYKEKTIHLGSFEEQEAAALHRENYIIKNGLDAKMNFESQTLPLPSPPQLKDK